MRWSVCAGVDFGVTQTLGHQENVDFGGAHRSYVTRAVVADCFGSGSVDPKFGLGECASCHEVSISQTAASTPVSAATDRSSLLALIIKYPSLHQ